MATAQQVAHYQDLAVQAEAMRIAFAAGHRARQIEANRQQAARIAGLTWSDVVCAIRALGMPEANEDLVRVLRAVHHVVSERGYENAAELLESLDIAAECVEELRMPLAPSEREQAEADERDRADNELDARRERECEAAEHYADVKSDEAAARYFEERRDAL